MKRKPAAKPMLGDRQQTNPPPEAPAVEEKCRRCGASGPLGDDGFCAGCEKALEQACL